MWECGTHCWAYAAVVLLLHKKIKGHGIDILENWRLNGATKTRNNNNNNNKWHKWHTSVILNVVDGGWVGVRVIFMDDANRHQCVTHATRLIITSVFSSGEKKKKKILNYLIIFFFF